MSRAVIEERVDLQPRNTLRLPGQARWFARIRQDAAIPELFSWAEEQGLPVMVIGGGSNIVLRSGFQGLVLAMAMRERHWEMVDADTARLTLGAGENWHDTVIYACKAGYRGIENLALIPGTVGAAPIQNIGAYGADLSQVLDSLDAWDRQESRFRTFTPEECGFGYRDSVFKRDPERFIITRVRLSLSRHRPFQLSYGELAEEYGHLQDPDSELTPLEVAKTVSDIRRRKLPDPSFLPNAGSFFKNPVVTPETVAELRREWPELIAYPENEHYKLAAGWLIDQCGWKGYRESHVGVHSRQALVLIHHGNGTGAELLELAERIREDVQGRFGVSLEMEPRVVGNQ